MKPFFPSQPHKNQKRWVSFKVPKWISFALPESFFLCFAAIAVSLACMSESKTSTKKLPPPGLIFQMYSAENKYSALSVVYPAEGEAARADAHWEVEEADAGKAAAFLATNPSEAMSSLEGISTSREPDEEVGTRRVVTRTKTLLASEVVELKSFFTPAKIAAYEADPTTMASSNPYPRLSVMHRSVVAESNARLTFFGSPSGEAALLTEYLTRLFEKVKAD